EDGIRDFHVTGVQTCALPIFAYHITEDFFLEAAYGTSKTEKTSYELLSGGVELLTEDERDLTYYNLSIGYNFLHGQVYISGKWRSEELRVGFEGVKSYVTLTT